MQDMHHHHHPAVCAVTLVIVCCMSVGSDGQLFNLFGLTVTSNKVKLPIGATASDFLSTYDQASKVLKSGLLNGSKKSKKFRDDDSSGCVCPSGDRDLGSGTSPDYQEMRHLIGGSLFS